MDQASAAVAVERTHWEVIIAVGIQGITMLLAIGAFIVAWRGRAKQEGKIEGSGEAAVADLRRRLEEHVAEASRMIPEFHELKAIVAGQVTASENLGRNIDRLYDLHKQQHDDVQRLLEAILRLHPGIGKV